MEQFEFDFEGDPLAQLTQQELVQRYKEAVGKDPTGRGLDQKQLIAGITDPQKELARLAEEDAQSDKEEIRNTYRR